MRNSAAERLDAGPSAEGGMTRLAFSRALEKCVDVDALLHLPPNRGAGCAGQPIQAMTRSRRCG